MAVQTASCDFLFLGCLFDRTGRMQAHYLWKAKSQLILPRISLNYTMGRLSFLLRCFATAIPKKLSCKPLSLGVFVLVKETSHASRSLNSDAAFSVSVDESYVVLVSVQVANAGERVSQTAKDRTIRFLMPQIVLF